MHHVCLILIATFFGFFNSSYAAENDVSEKSACLPSHVKTQNKEIILPGPEKQDKKQAVEVYFIKNASEKGLWIEHPVARASASAGWSSYIMPGNWAALMLNRKNFSLRCAVIHPGKVEELDCVKALSVCTPQSVKVNSSRKGSYWLAEDKSWDELIKAVEKRGVEVK